MAFRTNPTYKRLQTTARVVRYLFSRWAGRPVWDPYSCQPRSDGLVSTLRRRPPGIGGPWAWPSSRSTVAGGIERTSSGSAPERTQAPQAERRLAAACRGWGIRPQRRADPRTVHGAALQRRQGDHSLAGRRQGQRMLVAVDTESAQQP